ARRHTSYASVTVDPVIDDRIAVDIKDSDVRVDMLRASGAGGQHVNKTESAIRLTHIPTNIVVYCQNDRSQHRNRAQAWQMLRARLYELELKRREEQAAVEQANKTDIGFGAGEVAVARCHAVAVVDLDHLAVAALPAGECHRAVCGRAHRVARLAAHVETGVHRRRFQEWINPHAEARRGIDLAGDRL